ncbi:MULTISPECIES: PLD nuclease N-terminal domain-containing protein [Bacteria]|uniref:PLD nuclease N-terminal domain-containing protein n=1 Tax=Bacteria TaxID=2 RepID=UPI003C7A78F8
MPILFSVLLLALTIGALIDIITRPDDQVKHLPKVFWIILVILVPLAGSIIWFLVGRDYGDRGVRIPRMQRGAAASAAPAPPAPPVDTRTTEQQIADLDREIEEWRLRAEIEKRKREQEEGDTAP